MRLVRHEQRRFSDKPLVLSKDGQNHHALRLRHILDAQSDVALNAMTKIHIDTSVECIQIMYDLYMDALNFSHRGKTLARASSSSPQYHCYYLVFKDLEEIINRQYSKAQRQHEKMKKLCCPYCEAPRPKSQSPRPSPSSPAYSLTVKSSSSSSSSDGIPSPQPPRIVRSRTHVALLDETETDDL
jgi:hypothetical protein